VKIPMGVANSVSYNMDYDPVDTLSYAVQSDFDIIQIYINHEMLEKKKDLETLSTNIRNLSKADIYFHAEDAFNEAFTKSKYRESFFSYLNEFTRPRVIYHFDESEELDTILKIVDHLSNENQHIYLENYFQFSGRILAEKNLRKFTAVFSLANNAGVRIRPVIDIPRFYQSKIGFSEEEALNWCFQLLNFFGNRDLPIILHLIDTQTREQDRSGFCPLGEGSIPYETIFDFILKNKVGLEGIIFEYLDKVNPLKSRENLKHLFGMV